MLKTKINILGTDWKVSFLDDDKYNKAVNGRGGAPEDLGDATSGTCFRREHEIFVAASQWEHGWYMIPEILQVFWHEVGHAISSEAPNNTTSGSEYVPIMMEFMYKIQPQIRRIEREYTKKAKEYNGKVKS